MSLGDFNDETFKYQILDGLTVDDYIAFPSDECVEGAAVTRNAEDLYDDTDDMDDGDAGLTDLGDYEDGNDAGLTDMGDAYEDAGSGEEVYE